MYNLWRKEVVLMIADGAQAMENEWPHFAVIQPVKPA
jgi:hypothetical protein